MQVYIWKGINAAGKEITAEMEADSEEQVIAALRRRKLKIISVRKKPAELRLPFGRGGSVSVKDLAIFTRQFSTMINAGLPLDQCLNILSKQAEKESFQKAIAKINQEVEKGSTLAEALAKFKNIFNDLYINMVKAGEAGGILDQILHRLALFLEKSDQLRRKVFAAMMYPVVITFVAIGATSFMLLFIIPIFATMFAGFGAKLPLPTRIVVFMADVLRGYWWLILSIIAGVFLALRAYKKTDQGEKVLDGLKLKAPVFGDIIKKIAVARFTRTLGTLLNSGVPIIEGLIVTSKTTGNRVIGDAILSARISISEGQTIAAPLEKTRVFPPMVIQMIEVGEQTGNLDEMLNKVADFYDDEVDTAVSGIMSILEPIIIVALGVLIGGMVIAMYLPLFDIIKVAGGSK
ncbi:MAG: type II secretion system F family protein [Candidatus Coatesbacteria bacterium]|nr:type II secretion system F family protein [Candidatus Coatesbacteria bacterium]